MDYFQTTDVTQIWSFDCIDSNNLKLTADSFSPMKKGTPLAPQRMYNKACF